MVEETRGVSILNFLRVAVTELKTELRELWDKVIPRLLQSLTDDEENKKFDPNNWQDVILKVFILGIVFIREEFFCFSFFRKHSISAIEKTGSVISVLVLLNNYLYIPN